MGEIGGGAGGRDRGEVCVQQRGVETGVDVQEWT